jgi:hypothetical protein
VGNNKLVGCVSPRVRAAFVALLVSGFLSRGVAEAGKPMTCLDQIAWRGDGAAGAATRLELARGLLAHAPPTACRDTTIEIHSQPRGFAVRLRRADRSVERTSEELVAVASWIESWLATSIPVPRAADAENPPLRPPKLRVPAEQPTPGIPYHIGVGAMLDLDGLGPTWLGVRVDAALALSRSFWLGMDAAGSWVPKRRSVERRAFRIAAHAGWWRPLGWGTLRLGGGIGLVSASARRELEGQRDATDEYAGPYVEVLAQLDLTLSEHWAAVLGAGARAYIPDDLGQPRVTDSPSEALDPTPLPAIAATLQLGIAWHARWVP